jgi:hypothetical protein
MLEHIISIELSREGFSLHAVDLLFQFLGLEISAISTKNKKEHTSNG